MHIRRATTRDLPRLTQITVTSLVDDPTFDYLYPKRHDFPEDNYYFWQLQLKKWLYDPKKEFLVVVLGAQDPIPPEERPPIPDTVISFVVWERLGHSATAKRGWAKKNTWQNFLDRNIARLEAWSTSRKHNRRDIDMWRLAAIRKASEHDRNECFGDISEMWNLRLLITDREFRGWGAGTRLIKWGTTEADKEGVCCRVAASGVSARVCEVNGGFHKLKTTVVKIDSRDGSGINYDVMRRDARAAGYSSDVERDVRRWAMSIQQGTYLG